MFGSNKSLTRSAAALLLVFTVLLASCAGPTPGPAIQPSLTKTGLGIDLTPFIASEKTLTPPPILISTITPFPSPTPTPRTHEVKKGEDLFGISLLYGVGLEALMAANPQVNPNLMSVGTVLVIPGSVGEESIDVTPVVFPTPTAIPLETGDISCAVNQEGGAWCSQLLLNLQAIPLEGVSATFYLLDANSQDTLAQQVFLPLDLIHPGQSLPLIAYFPPPLPEVFQVSAEISSALPYPEDGRYLPIHIDLGEILLAENGLSAAVALDISLAAQEGSASLVRVAATAYDQAGKVIGLRRLEQTGDQLLKAGQTLAVRFNIYSHSGPIHQVELAAEARP